MGDFEVDTRVSGGAGAYGAELSSDWEIWGPNGGYLASIALRAAGQEAAIKRPVSFSAHFLRVARFETVDLEVETIHSGRRSESIRVRMSQGGRTVLEGLLRTAAPGPGLEHDRSELPEVPRPEDLLPHEALATPDAPRGYPFWDNIEQRSITPERFREEPSAREPVFRQWFRFRPRSCFSDPFVDAARSLVLIDTLSWIAACQPHPNAAFRAPNLEITAWFHVSDAEEPWLFADQLCPMAAEGLMWSTGRVWSRNGRLLASGGSQLLCVPWE